ncbi:copper resistance CopC family protein [Micromonospora pattaloongensis]|uniref:copper resistance CopC family protein n=1 Tax=Micromonospora pattaloongensis TaxID=405436 RepID=UPI001FE12727|nr:copper resistance CopC family protein [Micromonospora pattaloongensis]
MSLVVITGVLGVLVGAAPAAAHNSLTGSDPRNGTRLERPPAQLRLTFLSRLDPATTKITVTGPDNVPAAGGRPRFDGSRVAVPFKPGAAGLYIVEYEVASGDGHPITGEVRFTLTVAATPTASPTPTAPTAASNSVAPTPGAGATPSAAAADAAGGSNGGVPWWPWVLGGVVVLAALTTLVLARRRRSQA